MGIEPAHRGFADLFANSHILLISNGLEVIQRRLGTTLGPNCTRKNLQPQAARQRFVVRVSFTDPLHIGDHPAEPNSVRRKLHILLRLTCVTDQAHT